MKRILFVALFALFSASAFAQNTDPRVEVKSKAQFLTEQFTALLSLDTQQQETILNLNKRRFRKEYMLKEKVYRSEHYQEIQNENFFSPRYQLAIAKLDEKIEEVENKYDNFVKITVSDAQYQLYLTNKQSLLQSVIDEFGE